jgi:hypothetical protein
MDQNSLCQAFLFSPRSSRMAQQYHLDAQIMAMVCSPQPPKETQGQKPLQTPQSQNEGAKDPPQLTATAPPLPPSYPGPPHGCYPLQQGVAGRGRIYVSFQMSGLKEMKKDLDNYTVNLDQYIKVYITIIQTCCLAWKDVMLLLDQTPTSLEKQ